MNYKKVNYNELKNKILIIGDVMLDSYWKGDCSRISPEAPVQVLKVQNTEQRPGGAANVALNIASIGGKSLLVSLVGEDDNSNILNNLLKDANVDSQLIKVKECPTITKLRVLARNQQLLRIDFEEDLSSVDHALVLSKTRQLIKDVKLVICSDYGKGTLSSIPTIIQIANENNIPVLIDPKGNDFSKYKNAFLLTPNMKEFEEIVGKVDSESDLENKALNLISTLNLKALLITRSEKGMTLVRPGQKAFNLPTEAKEVYDVTGAGDTVISFLGLCLANNYPIEDSCVIANVAAGIVVGKVGTATVSQQELDSAIENYIKNK